MLMITKRDGVWRLTVVGVAEVVAQHAKKDCLVRLARIMAGRCGHTMYVYSETGHLESMRTFAGQAV